MTREEILINSVWERGKMMAYSPFFNKEIEVELIVSTYALKYIETIISEKFVQTVNDLLALPETERPLMQSLLYRHCLECCKDISYGIDVPDGETEQEANLREFGVSNETDALEKANPTHAIVEEDNFFGNRYVRIIFEPEWESEHGCELILRNGKLLDHIGDGNTSLIQFEEVEE